MTRYIQSWDRLLSLGIKETGSKAWNIARLRKFGFIVPDGFMVSPNLADLVLESPPVATLLAGLPALADRDINHDALTNRLAEIRAAIRKVALPADFLAELSAALDARALAEAPCAVRSSGLMEDGMQASFAGIHESSLNVIGLDNIVDAILGCVASAWQVRAVAYRQKFGIGDEGARLSIVVMPMIDADAGGVVFTADPVTGDRTSVVIAANIGLPISVVEAADQSDHYVIDTSTFACVERFASIASKKSAHKLAPGGGLATVDLPPDRRNSPVLTQAERTMLAEKAMRIQDALSEDDEPYDIEWAKVGKTIVFLQARPITVLNTDIDTSGGKLSAVWSTANLKDASPGVQSPLGADLMRNMMRDILLTPFRMTGYRDAERAHLSRLISGRPYLNMSAMQWIYYDAFGVHPKELNEAIGGYQGDTFEVGNLPAEAMGKRLLKAVRRTRLVIFILLAIGFFFWKEKGWVAKAEDERLQRWSSLADSELLHVMMARHRMVKQAGRLFQMMNSVSGWAYGLLFKAIGKSGVDNPESLTARLLAGTGGVASAAYAEDLWHLAVALKADAAFSMYSRVDLPVSAFVAALSSHTAPSEFKRQFDQFLEKYGHRAVYEMEISNPRWIEDPSYLLKNVILLSRETRAARDPRQLYLQAIDELRAHVGRNSVRWNVLRLCIHGARFSMRLRENAKSLLVKSAQPLRSALLETGRRFSTAGWIEQREYIFYCSWWDLAEALNGRHAGAGFDALVGARRSRESKWALDNPDDVITTATQPARAVPRAPKSAAERRKQSRISGIGVSSGITEGIARFIDHPDQYHKLQLGEILIAQTSDPAWTPLFFRAGGVVLEMGGMLSHGSILARELGIPAVANIRNARDYVADGDLIRVDGERGEVVLLTA